MELIRIALLDSNELFRRGLESYLSCQEEFTVVLSLEDISELHDKVIPGTLDLVIIDTAYLNEEEWKIAGRFIHNFPELIFMALTLQVSLPMMEKLQKIRLLNFYSKECTSNQLKSAIKEITFSPSTNFNFMKFGPRVEKLVQKNKVNKPTVKDVSPQSIQFSKREIDVLYLSSLEYTCAEIAELLEIGVRTVETHRRRIIKKTNSRSMMGAIVLAYKAGMSF